MRQKVRPALEFGEMFIRGGYRKVEHLFGHRTSINILFREMCGGNELRAERNMARKAK